jgi:hypothetical protein
MKTLIYVAFFFRYLGVFLSYDLRQNELLKDKKFELKVWTLPASEFVKMRKVAQLLNELPLQSSLRNASVELRSDSRNHSMQFESALKAENLCLNTLPRVDGKIIVYVGKAENLPPVKLEANETWIIVPFSTENLVMSGEN